MRRHERDDTERINDAWNARSRDGAPSGAANGTGIGKASAAHGADELTLAITRLETRDDAPHVDHAFADELLRGLVARHPASAIGPTDRRRVRRGAVAVAIDPAPPAVSRARGGKRRLPGPTVDRRFSVPWRSGLVDAIAVAAVVLLVGVALIGDRAGVFTGRSGTEPGVQRHGTSGPGASLPLTAMHRGDAGRTGAMPGPGPIGTPLVMWTNDTNDVMGETLISANGRVFAISSTSGEPPFDLIAIELESGEDLWRSPIDADSTSVPAVANGLVYVMAASGLTAVHESTGEVAWSAPGGEIGFSSTPLVDEGVVYMVTSDYSMRALDAVSGEPVWTVPLPGMPPVEGYSWGMTSIAVAGGKVFGRGNEGLIFALDIKNGDLIWNMRLEGSADEPFLVSDGVVAVTASMFDVEGGPLPVLLHALDAATGESVWEPVELPTLATLAAADGSLFVADALHETGALRALDIHTGEPRWTWEGAGPLRSPAVVDGALYVAGDGDGTVYRLDAATGTPDWSVRLGFMRDPLVTGGLLLVMANGTVTAIAGDGEDAAVAPDAEPPDLSGLPLCAPPRLVPNEPLWGEPAATIDVETRLIEPIGDPPVTEDGRPVESITWPQMLTANLPTGERATAEEVGGVRATLDAMGDCTRRPEGTGQIPAFFSDDFFRRGSVTPDPDGYELTWNRQPEGDELDRLEVFALDDGRVGASTVADSGSGIFLAFVEVDGTWLIDEFYEVVPEYFEGPIG